MRSCGQSYAGIEKFTSLMNMPRPITKNNYDKSANVIMKATHTVAEETIADAVEEIRNTVDDEIVDTSVSCDGSW